MENRLKVLTTLILTATMLLAIWLVPRNIHNASEAKSIDSALENLLGQANMFGLGDAFEGIPTAADYRRAILVDIIFVLSCLVGIAFTSLRYNKVGLLVAAAIAVIGILLYVYQPHPKGVAISNNNYYDKPLAMGISIATLVGASLLALLKLMFAERPAQQYTPIQLASEDEMVS